ncbi:unannotated protein [freshwater metagenome]|uniref:Unannotated protein n=1 Tax=freshwater metagenome TaxID=449393 RepID=A0A6J7C6H2_9ZZZZ
MYALEPNVRAEFFCNSYRYTIVFPNGSVTLSNIHRYAMFEHNRFAHP